MLMSFWGNFNLAKDHRTADRSSAEIAPDPAETKEAIVQVYTARAFNWRGIFSLHSWIATKETGASYYTIYQVIGWRVRRNLPALVALQDIPDRNWFGARPKIISDLRGEPATKAITGINQAVEEYPYAGKYTLWPGPNSNTFTAHVARRVPELAAEIPSTAIGKDFLTNDSIIGPAPSGTGYQLSLYGLVGLLLAKDEGLEINLLGLIFGIDPLGPAIKLPFIGRLGFSLDQPKT